MRTWETAVDAFIKEWRNKDEVVAALVCGSYITGNPSKRSDIDIHIILSDEVDWRERGNQIVNGFLIEYFVNPPKQIRKYFEEDYFDNSSMSMVQFITGKAIFDHIGIIKILKSEASDWKNKQYKELDNTLKEIKKYGLWDTMDNLFDCFESDRPDFQYVYFNSLTKLFKEYSYFLGIEQIPFYQINNYLSDPKYLTKYLKSEFPDNKFSDLFLTSIQATDRNEMMTHFEALTNHVLVNAGGYQINGWRIRSSVK
jgi:hypothetical protein